MRVRGARLARGKPGLRRFLVLALAAVCAAAGPLGAQQKSDWEIQQEEREWKEIEIRLPAPPRPGGLIEFFVSSASSFKFFIDAPSLSVDADGVVRYTLVARSPAGVENVSFEGMRCKSGAYRVYAFANGGAWSRTNSEWTPIEPRSVQRWHNELRGRYFCPLRLSIQSAAEGLEALRRGGHPLASPSGQER